MKVRSLLSQVVWMQSYSLHADFKPLKHSLTVVVFFLNLCSVGTSIASLLYFNSFLNINYA